MNHIEKLHIEGFKKFESLDVSFNEHMNILVGENEAGKSTILEAIRIAFNQQYRTADKSVLKDLFNSRELEKFEKDPSIRNLPKIVIEAQLCLDLNQKNSIFFYGESYGNNGQKDEKFGIRFECKFDEELGADIIDFIEAGNIPFEYYSLMWTTYANRPYQTIKRPFHFLFIDTSSNSSTQSFNYYNKMLFTNKFDEGTQARAKNEFRAKLDDAFEGINLPPIEGSKKFGIDNKKIILENVLAVYENSISLENRGKGMESLVKTEIALKKAGGLDVILVEEPENHLCYSSLKKMLHNISKNEEESQIVVATHSNMIASSLNLNNVLWVTQNTVESLQNVDKHVANFFKKADNNSFLQLLLSPKTFLVEGATEYLLLPKFFKQLTGQSIEEAGISVISCNGISYKRYLEIAKKTNKRVAVITDNDKCKDKISAAQKFNIQNSQQHIFLSDDLEKWTWEVCLYYENREVLDDMIKTQENAQYPFNGEEYEKTLGKMLNTKVETAYQMLTSETNFSIPQYIKEAIEWQNK